MAYFEVKSKPRLTYPTLTGSIVTFNSQYAGLPLKSHYVEVVASQSGTGTPSPSNPRSISGTDSIHIQNTAGINQWDEQWRKGYYNRNNQGAYVSNNSYICNTNDIRVNPNTSYYWFIGISESYLQGRVLFFTADKQYISATEATSVNSVITTPNNCSYIRFYFYNDGNDYDNNCSINYPSTDTSYHAFVGQSVTIQIGSTVYGGNYDARTGVLTVTQVKEILRGSYFVTYSASIQCAGGGKPAGWLPWLKQTGGSCEMLSHGLPTTRSNIGNISNGCFIGDTTGGNREVMYIKFAGYSSLEDVQTFIEAQYNSNTPVEVVYELATPQTIQLPPCPIDTIANSVNNIWADTGDTTLQYPKFG